MAIGNWQYSAQPYVSSTPTTLLNRLTVHMWVEMLGVRRSYFAFHCRILAAARLVSPGPAVMSWYCMYRFIFQSLISSSAAGSLHHTMLRSHEIHNIICVCYMQRSESNRTQEILCRLTRDKSILTMQHSVRRQRYQLIQRSEDTTRRF